MNNCGKRGRLTHTPTSSRFGIHFPRSLLIHIYMKTERKREMEGRPLLLSFSACNFRKGNLFKAFFHLRFGMRPAETAPAAPQTGDARGAGAAASSSATGHDDDDRGAADAANDPAAPVPASARVPEAAPGRRYDDGGRWEAGPAAAVKSGILSSVHHTLHFVP